VGTNLSFRLLATEGEPGKDVCVLRGHQSGVQAVAASADGRYLLSAGTDTTLRLWDLQPLQAADPPKELRPVLSFFTAGPENWITWITWTPEGYYAASPTAEHLMGWQLDNGPRRLLSFYSADQGDETSREDSKSKHGYFTKWLLDGLQGAAGTNKAGEITLARLYVHVEEKVPAETDDQQHPVLVGLAAIRSFALARPAKFAKP
jgi:WD40 repeat protein